MKEYHYYANSSFKRFESEQPIEQPTCVLLPSMVRKIIEEIADGPTPFQLELPSRALVDFTHRAECFYWKMSCLSIHAIAGKPDEDNSLTDTAVLRFKSSIAHIHYLRVLPSSITQCYA